MALNESAPLFQNQNVEGQPGQKPYRKIYKGDARHLTFLPNNQVDLVITSPPYWQKRDYGCEGQIGQEKTPGEFVQNILSAMGEWRRVLRPTGSVFLNIGDTYWKKSLQGIPSLIEAGACGAGWVLRNRIIWVKKSGMPEPAQNRLAGRHEYILHFAVNGYYYDLFGYAEIYSAGLKGANPGDIWEIAPERNLGKHLAPFPRCSVPKCDGVKCNTQIIKETLWDKFYMVAPQRQRHSVEQYKIVKKA